MLMPRCDWCGWVMLHKQRICGACGHDHYEEGVEIYNTSNGVDCSGTDDTDSFE